MKKLLAEKPLDFFLELTMSFFKGEVTDKIKQKKLEVQVRDYICRQQKYFYDCSIKEEFDFEGFKNYINKEFLQDVELYLKEMNTEQKTKQKETIISTAVSKASANTKLSERNVENITSVAIDIIEGFYISEYCDKKDVVLSSKLAGEILETIEKKSEDVKDELKGIKESLGIVCKTENFDLNKSIELQVENVKNQVIFPWFNESPKYREVFPKLFIEPVLKTNNRPVNYKVLLGETLSNIVILGDAGAGKSTLLRFLFAFHKFDDCNCFYLTARETMLDEKESLLNKIINDANSSKTRCLILVDGIDEAFHNDYQRFKEFISRIKVVSYCNFWLGCRTDFYKKSFSDDIAFVQKSYILCPWETEQIEKFINTYSEIVEIPELSSKIDKMLGDDDSIKSFKRNPFQLALLTFLADDKSKDKKIVIQSIYDLYEKFIQKWLDKEQKRGTSSENTRIIIEKLQLAAWKIYNNEKITLDEVSESNTAITDLLIIDEYDVYNRKVATAFYHRSLAAFFLAQNAIEAMLDDNFELLLKIFPSKLKDDVTNFIGAKFSTLSIEEKNRIKNNLERLYDKLTSDDMLSVKEQIIYYITRLGIDVSDFLKKVINPCPENLIMRLTIAYGAVLSENQEIRDFALQYAKSISNETEDAITNRAWTVIYFGDVDNDPYTYRDDEKSSWKNAREARIKRFTKAKPRLKDYRFRLFDIPLFYSFLKDRNWNDISKEEYDIIESIEIPDSVFNADEMAFLKEEKAKLLKGYEYNLRQLECSSETGNSTDEESNN